MILSPMTTVGFLAGAAAVVGFFYKLWLGNKTIPEALEEWRKRARKTARNGKAPIGSESLRVQLERLRINAAPGLKHLDQEQNARLDNPKIIIGNVLLDGEFLGFGGVNRDALHVEWNPHSTPRLPDYILEARDEIEQKSTREERDRNSSKVFLDNWKPPIIDDGNQVDLITSRSDWWMRKALRANVDRLQADILDGRASLSMLSRPLDTDAIVLTSDEKLILVYRGEVVSYEPNTWSLPGEQMDADKDFDSSMKSPSPWNTVMRLLTETDELHLPNHVAMSAETKFIALVTEWHLLLANLIAVVRLHDMDSTKVRDCFQKGEHGSITFVDFGPNQVQESFRLIADGSTIPAPGTTRSARLNDMTRLSMLGALFNMLGYFEMIEQIEARSR